MRTLAEQRDPRVDPKPGDRIYNYTRTVIAVKGEKVVFGIDRGEAHNCGAYVVSLQEWREWSAQSFAEDY